MLGEPGDGDERKDPFDGEYVGNIWGWRFSLLGLALIVVMAGIMVYRHISLGIPFGEQAPVETRIDPDSTVMRDTLTH